MKNENGLIIDEMVKLPDNTSKVERPPILPNKISVSNRSPTMIVRFGSNSTLQLSVLVVRIGNKGRTDLALMQSNMVLDGLPIFNGALFNKNRNGAMVAPAPGNKPPRVWYTLSSFVARKRQPGLRVRYWNAFDSLV
jgi:hypothetical protein